MLNLELLGSGRVAYLEGEGLVSRRPYEPDLVQIAAEAAAEEEFAGGRGLRSAPFLTDAYVAGLHGIPALTVLSLDEDESVRSYHWPSDTLENVDARSLEQGYRLSRRL